MIPVLRAQSRVIPEHMLKCRAICEWKPEGKLGKQNVGVTLSTLAPTLFTLYGLGGRFLTWGQGLYK